MSCGLIVQADFIQENSLPYTMMQQKEVAAIVDDLAAVAFSVGNSGLGSDLRNGQGLHFYKVIPLECSTSDGTRKHASRHGLDRQVQR